MSSNLCGPCSHILIKNNRIGVFYRHHSSPLDLRNCNCNLCKLLCDGWDHQGSFSAEAGEVKTEDFTDFTFRLGFERTMEENPFVIGFFASCLDQNKMDDATPISRRYYRQDFLLVESDEADRSEVVSMNTGTEDCWRLAMRWLETCFDTHSKCARTQIPNWMPARLLDVGMQDSRFIRLHETNATTIQLPYATLSHCWGKIEIKRLLQGNIKECRKGIEIDVLPKTFQDAITITRKLGIRHLWIDSLCIVQDSAEDWAEQSSVMGKVYQNGYCNIAATGAHDGRAGCFLERDPKLAQKCRVKLETNLRKFKLRHGLYDLVPRSLWDVGLYVAPLNRRAWVAQERIMAPRILHFSSNQLFWECTELDACEMYPNGAPPTLAQADSEDPIPPISEMRGLQFGFKRLHFKNLDPTSVRSEIHIAKTEWALSLSPPLPSFRLPLPSGPSVDPYYVWNKILLAYSGRALTKNTDKLVAISAVAKQIQEMTEDQYVAGLWRKHFEHHLLWLADQSNEGRKRATQYVAPSWSWASVNTTIRPHIYIRPGSPTMVQILEVKIETLTLDVTGQVSGGYLKLRGWLKKISLADDKSWTIRMFKAQIADTTMFDEPRTIRDDEVWFLPIIFIGPWLECQIFGLMLEETGEENEFKRVGMFKSGYDFRSEFLRPAYPIQNDLVVTYSQGGSGARAGNNDEGESIKINNLRTDLNNKENKWWFGRLKNAIGKKGWEERIITII